MSLSSPSPVELSLVVLAAGMGRRFGSLKQVAPVGPRREALVDLTIADAAAAGVDRVIAVVRPRIHDEVVDHLRRRSPLPVEAVEQDDPPPGRSTPWGTAEAVALALDAAPGPVVVANADDHYGADALGALVSWLRSPSCRAGRAALVTWPLRATLPPRGDVTRAVCSLSGDGTTVTGMVEHHGVTASDAGPTRPGGEVLAPDAPTSMNLWGLHPSVAPDLHRAVRAFRAAHADDAEAELPLPSAVDREVAEGRLVVEALPAGTTWVGVTHPDDLEPARRALAGIAAAPTR